MRKRSFRQPGTARRPQGSNAAPKSLACDILAVSPFASRFCRRRLISPAPRYCKQRFWRTGRKKRNIHIPASYPPVSADPRKAQPASRSTRSSSRVFMRC